MLSTNLEMLKGKHMQMHIWAIEKVVKKWCPILRHMCTLKNNLHWHTDEVKMEKTYTFYKMFKN